MRTYVCNPRTDNSLPENVKGNILILPAKQEVSMSFVHLHTHSNFTFLDGVASLEELVARATSLGMRSLALTDRNGLYGAIRFYRQAREAGLKPILGSEVGFEDGSTLVLLVPSYPGYQSLCRLLTEMHLSHPLRDAQCSMKILQSNSAELIALSGGYGSAIWTKLAKDDFDGALQVAEKYLDIFGSKNFFIELQRTRKADGKMVPRLAEIAHRLGIRCVATNDVHYPFRGGALLRKVWLANSLKKSMEIQERGKRKGTSPFPTSERLYLKSPQEMSELFSDMPDALKATVEIAERCHLDLDSLRQNNSAFPSTDRRSDDLLRQATFAGAKRRYGKLSGEVEERLERELSIIKEQGFSEYFLIMGEIGDFARQRKIPWSVRGSAPSSLVLYALGITEIDSIANGLVFERFMNPLRRTLPDIDIDFCSHRREEVIDYVCERFRGKAAVIATVNTTTARSAVRAVAKGFGYTPQEINALSRKVPMVSAYRIREVLREYPELVNSPLRSKDFKQFLDLVEKLDAFPRHISTHLGGVVISSRPLTDLAPLQWSAKGTIICQYDKDDVSYLGLPKVDILGLRMHSAIAEAIELVEEVRGERLSYVDFPLDDEETYELVRRGDTVGVFQLESSGQRNLARRLHQENFFDLVASISLHRPGPIQADMISPFVRRRHGLEKVKVSHPALEPILRETYGVIIFQEQVLKILHEIAGLSLNEAEAFRREMTLDKSEEEMAELGRVFVERAVQEGVERDIAEEIFSKVSCFAAFGFPKSHACSFARLGYASAYLKAHYPAEFLAAILNNQPMGFYSSFVVVNDARRLGIEILPLDINESEEGFTVQRGGKALRTGLAWVKQIGPRTLEKIMEEKQKGVFVSFGDFYRRTGVPISAAENLIRVGAFDSLGRPREQLLVNLPQLHRELMRMSRWRRKQTELFERELEGAQFEPWSLKEKLKHELDVLGFAVSAHPLSFYEEELRALKVIPSIQLPGLPDRSWVRIAGVLERVQTPPTRSGRRTMFLTLEDACGLLEVTVFENTLQKYGLVISESSSLLIEGFLQNNLEQGLTVVAGKIRNLACVLRSAKEIAAA
jgi:error-prone DNA polymerase